MSRRRFIRAAAGAAGLAFAGCARPDAAPDAPPSASGDTAAGLAGRYDGLASSRYLGDVRVETQVTDAAVFTEGPAVDRAGTVFFTNIPASKILRWDPAGRTLSVFREHTGQTNGLLFDTQGRLLACEGEAGRVSRTDMQTGAVTVLADGFEGRPLEAPNDLALDAAGRIYFTSRPTADVPSKGHVNAVYRIDPDGTLHQLLREPDVQMPNGIVTSPDDAVLYLIEAHGEADRARLIRAYDLNPDGTVARPRVLVDFYPGRSGDGMCIDAEGNLYVAAGLHALRGSSETLDTKPGIHVFSPAGELLAYAPTPEDTITNCTFGGDDLQTLYVTCGSLLLSLPTRIPGKPAYRPLA